MRKCKEEAWAGRGEREELAREAKRRVSGPGPGQEREKARGGKGKNGSLPGSAEITKMWFLPWFLSHQGPAFFSSDMTACMGSGSQYILQWGEKGGDIKEGRRKKSKRARASLHGGEGRRGSRA